MVKRNRNFERYHTAWILRQQGKTYKEIGKFMGFSLERARVMVKYIDFLIKERPYRMSKDLKELVKKYSR